MKNYLITQRNSLDVYGQTIDSLENNYIRYFSNFKLNVIPVPNVNFNVNVLHNTIKLSGIILSGGGDVDPELYGNLRDESLNISFNRDKIEYSLMNFSIKQNIPVLGLCRGMQLINIYFGGKIKKSKNNLHPTGKNHRIKIVDKEICNQLGVNMQIVNSFHDFIIPQKYLSNELTSFAVDFFGNVEGYKHSNFPIWGLQWHPERNCPSDELNNLIIKRFLES